MQREERDQHANHHHCSHRPQRDGNSGDATDAVLANGEISLIDIAEVFVVIIEVIVGRIVFRTIRIGIDN